MDSIKISRGIPVEKIGKNMEYHFSDQCDWSKETDLQKVGRMCSHDDCKKAFWINRTINMLRKELLELTKIYA